MLTNHCIVTLYYIPPPIMGPPIMGPMGTPKGPPRMGPGGPPRMGGPPRIMPLPMGGPPRIMPRIMPLPMGIPLIIGLKGKDGGKGHILDRTEALWIQGRSQG